jgi:putative restriction endonuclease
LHSPENFVVGGGFFAAFSRLPCSLAWETFGEANGTVSLDEMRRRVEKYRRTPPAPHEDYNVGCVILESAFFFGDSDWIPVPEDFSLSIQKGKTYDLATSTGRALWEAVQQRLRASSVLEPVEATMYGQPTLVRPRLGQGGFRVLVTDIYQRKCAVTGEKALPVLEAAHILAVAKGGQHRVDNGLLLRSDVHRLFDKGYLTVTPDHRVRVSRRLRDEFDNGEPYFPLDGQSIWLPSQVESQPRRDFLEWHSDTVFKG